MLICRSVFLRSKGGSLTLVGRECWRKGGKIDRRLVIFKQARDCFYRKSQQVIC